MYAKIVLHDGTEYPLESYNVGDIKAAFREIKQHNKKYPNNKVMVWEEFENTNAILDQIPWHGGGY